MDPWRGRVAEFSNAFWAKGIRLLRSRLRCVTERRVDGDRWRQRARTQILPKPFPRPAPTIRSPIEPVPPATLDFAQEATQAVRVPGDPVVPVVPPELLSQLTVLSAYWRMAVLAAPPSDPRDRPTQAIRGCCECRDKSGSGT